MGVAPVEALAVDDRVVLSDTSMTNGHLAVRWDAHGNITSIIDLARAREIVPDGEFAAALELAVDHPVEYDAWDVESWTVDSGTALTAGGGAAVESDGRRRPARRSRPRRAGTSGRRPP